MFSFLILLGAILWYFILVLGIRNYQRSWKYGGWQSLICTEKTCTWFITVIPRQGLTSVENIFLSSVLSAFLSQNFLHLRAPPSPLNSAKFSLISDLSAFLPKNFYVFATTSPHLRHPPCRPIVSPRKQISRKWSCIFLHNFAGPYAHR